MNGDEIYYLERIRELEEEIESLKLLYQSPYSNPKMFGRKAVFLDRDGTVIESIHRPGFPEGEAKKKEITAPFTLDEYSLVPGAYSARDKLRNHGFLVILVTNQPDVAHGYMDEDSWRKIQKRVEDTLGLDDIFMCRHRAEDNCPFKKPSPLMLRAAADKFGIDLSRSWMVGDTDTDMQTGRAAGCRVILIDKPLPLYNQNLGSSDYEYRASNILDAVDYIIDKSK